MLLGRLACLSAIQATSSPRYGVCSLKNLSGFCSFCDFGIWVFFVCDFYFFIFAFLLMLCSFHRTMYPLCGFVFLGFVASVILASGCCSSFWFSS